MQSRAVQTAHGNPFYVQRPTLELRLDPLPLSPALSRAIKRHGEYTECRGHCDHRYVTLRFGKAVEPLVDELLRTHPSRRRSEATCVVFCGFGRARNVVTHAETFAEAYAAFLHATRHDFRAGRLPKVLSAADRRARAVHMLRAQLEAARTTVAAMEAQLRALGELT